MLSQFGSLGNVCMWWLEESHRLMDEWTAYFRCVALLMHLCMKLRKIRKKLLTVYVFVFTYSFGNHLSITYSFGQLIIWQMSFRKKTKSIKIIINDINITFHHHIGKLSNKNYLSIYKLAPKLEQSRLNWLR